METSKHGSLLNYLKFIESQYNVKICINDFTGFIPSDKDLDKILQLFFAHTNEYCMYVKSDKTLMQKCQDMKKSIFEKCIKSKTPFYGVCHAGVGELIFPIFHGEKLLGILNVGVFKNDTLKQYYIKKICTNSNLDAGIALSLYNSSIVDFTTEEASIRIILGFICDYLSNTYEKLSLDYHTKTLFKKRNNSSEDFIISHCVQFIQENYKNDITVAMLKTICHCSDSYINHVFKKRSGKNIRQYINNLRINESIELLTTSKKNISEISQNVGFKDPDYFSKVFTSITGISPKKYRDRF